MRQLTVRVARRLNKLWGRGGKFWAERFHSQVVTSPSEVLNVLLYTLNSAHKHRSWFDHSTPDPYSSSCWFEGWPGHRPEARDESCPVVVPRSWLASQGWRVAKRRPSVS